MKLYLNPSFDEIARTIDEWMDTMKFSQIEEMEIFEAEPEKVKGFFWCRVYSSAGDKSESTCGKQCNDYSPRNGKSGCCRHYSTTFYEMSDKKTTIKIK